MSAYVEPLRRSMALAGVALVAALGAIALSRSDGDEEGPAATPATAGPGGGWRQAVVSSFGPGLYGRETACGIELGPATRGIAHPVLPCGAKLVVSFRGRATTVAVVERSPVGSGREFDLTEALAADLQLDGAGRVRWRFATGESVE